MKYIALIVLTFLQFYSFSQIKVRVDTVVVKPTNSFQYDNDLPKVVPLNINYAKAAGRINNFILDRFSLKSYKLQDGESFSYSDTKFEAAVNQEYLYIKMNGGYLGAYPTEFEEEYVFSVETGHEMEIKDFPFHSLFSLNGYFNFLNDFWLDDAKKEFQFPEDPDNECGGVVPYCTYYDIVDYSIEDQKLYFRLTLDCFPRVIRACSPFLSKKVAIDTLHNYLSEVGKTLIFEKNYTQISGIEKFKVNQNISPKLKDNIFFFGKIDKKYPFSMAINIDDYDQISGFYWYDSQLKKIKIVGKRVGNQLLLSESYKGKSTGNFVFTFGSEHNSEGFSIYDPFGDDDKYLTGKWSNPDKTKVFRIGFYEVKSNRKI